MVGDSSEADSSDFGLDSDTVIYGRCNSLGAAEITLSGLHGNMPKKKLNPLRFTARGAAKPSATSTEIVRGEFAYANLSGELLDDVPDQLLRDGLTPNLAGAAYTSKETASFDSSRSRPVVEQGGHPVRHGNGANMTCLATEVHDSRAGTRAEHRDRKGS
jgi:hypothetical protein